MSDGRGRDPTRHAHLLDARPLTGSEASGIGALGGTSLLADADGLTLADRGGRELRRWSWSDVEGWDADGSARDGEGSWRQVLGVRARPAPFAVLADAASLGAFLPLMAAAQAEGRRRAAQAARARVLRGRPLKIAVASAALVAGLAGAAPSLFAAAASHRPPAPHAHHGNVLARSGTRPFHLPKATAAPAPAAPAVAAAPMAAHEVFGFLPYWVLPDPGEVDLGGLTTVAYFSVDVNRDGTVDESPTSPGWVGYQSQALADLVSAAHHDGERAVLSATCFDQASLDALTHDPVAQATLAATLVALVRAKSLDGVNLDFEGTGPTDRVGLDQLVATVSRALHAADPAWQLTVDTYASSASDPSGFYDVRGMAPFVDAFVVMDYDMGGTFGAGPTAVAGGSAQGPGTGPFQASPYTDSEVVSSYTDAVGASKVVLAMPLYGEDWPTVGPTAGDPATGPPTPVADDQITPGDTVYWDPSTGGPWAVYRTGGQWHQVWFDDPASIAAKARLARSTGLRGVGLWALGMAAGTGDQQAAVTGVALEPQPPDGPVTVWSGPLPKWGLPSEEGPAPGVEGTGGVQAGGGPGAHGSGAAGGAASGTGAPGGSQSGSVPPASGVFGGVDVSLVPWPGTAPAGVSAAGTLSGFSVAAGTAVSCLAGGPPLPVVQIDGTSAYLVQARVPPDCASGTWAFVLPAGTAAGTGTGTTAGTGAGAVAGTGAVPAPATTQPRSTG